MTETMHLTLYFQLDVSIKLKGKKHGESCLAVGPICAHNPLTRRGSWEMHSSHVLAIIRHTGLSYHLTRYQLHTLPGFPCFYHKGTHQPYLDYYLLCKSTCRRKNKMEVCKYTYKYSYNTCNFIL